MSNISFTPRGWDDYTYWQTQDKKTLKRLNALLEDIVRNKFTGLGKPEPLKRRDGCMVKAYRRREQDCLSGNIYR